MRGKRRVLHPRGGVGFLVLVVGVLAGFGSAPAVAGSHSQRVAPHAVGALDCNGFSPIQRTVKLTGACTDPKGYDGGRFFDNGQYIGHDEPIIRFLSKRRRLGQRHHLDRAAAARPGGAARRSRTPAAT